MKKTLTLFEALVIIGFAFFPLFLTFPYRVNIFLSWEGAYRLSEGQLPFRDFGTPLGGMYWVVPAMFFKIFGTQLITLVKAQVFINIVSGFVFRNILLTLSVTPVVRAASVLLYTITFTFFNYWPWYNHSAIVYGLIAIAFILKFMFEEKRKPGWVLLLSGALFSFFCFFTKQDAGGLIFLICIVLLLYNSWIDKNWRAPVVYVGSTIALVFIAVLLFSQYDFSYWFNHGQPPHNARVSGFDIVNELMSESEWLKFYFFMVVLVVLSQLKEFKNFIKEKKEMTFLLLTMGILCLAAIFQITSYTPVKSNIFFHSFAFAFILNFLFRSLKIESSGITIPVFLCVGVLLWWSQLYWDYLQRIVIRNNNHAGEIVYSATGENVVGMHNARLKSKDVERKRLQGKWVSLNLPSLKNLTLPESTAKGIQRFMAMDLLKDKKDIRVLNMTELTFLAKEVPFALERDPKYPLWYHLGVGMFNREAIMFENRIKDHYYDVVLFEDIPTLNNFFPFRVRDSLRLYYQQVDSFAAPRSGEAGSVEVYIKKD